MPLNASLPPSRLDPFAAAMAAMHSGRLEVAVQGFREVLNRDPRHKTALTNLGLLLNTLGYHAEAVQQLQAALQNDPENAQLLRILGKEFLDWGNANGASHCFERLLRIAPDDSFALAHLGQLRRAQGSEEDARKLWAKALARDPKNADALCFLGMLEMESGRTKEAESYQRRALDADTAHGNAHFNLAQIARNGDAGQRVQQIERVLLAGNLPFDQEVPLHFAAAKILDGAEEVDRAFEHFSRGNRLVWSRCAIPGELYVRQTEELIQVFDAHYFQSRASGLDNSSSGEGLIFILGMPRSGTTLIEQILASHPAVAVGGERPDIRVLGETLPARFGLGEPYPFAARRLNVVSSQKIASEHFERIASLRGNKTYFSDKTPANFLRLGLIAALFPRAKIIHCRRDAMDICFSCYAQLFGRNSILYSYDLATLGLYYRLYERLMAHWRQVLPISIFDVSYEDLVSDQEQRTREILKFCGIPWDDSCLRFHERAGAVRTASMWQVRQAVYKTSVGRWRRYEKHLEPLLKALEISA